MLHPVSGGGTRKQSRGQKIPVCRQQGDEYPHTGMHAQCSTIMNVVNQYACTVQYNHECCESVCMHSAVQS